MFQIFKIKLDVKCQYNQECRSYHKLQNIFRKLMRPIVRKNIPCLKFSMVVLTEFFTFIFINRVVSKTYTNCLVKQPLRHPLLCTVGGLRNQLQLHSHLVVTFFHDQRKSLSLFVLAWFQHWKKDLSFISWSWDTEVTSWTFIWKHRHQIQHSGTNARSR